MRAVRSIPKATAEHNLGLLSDESNFSPPQIFKGRANCSYTVSFVTYKTTSQ
jgi:hypothetical protein